MITVQGDMQLADNTANAWFALRAAALAEFRVALRISSPAGAWRSPEMVMDMWLYPAKYGATKGTAKPRALGGPGSVHESGRCVDIYNWPAMGPTESKAITNLERLAARSGFTRTIKVEAWHYQHDGSGGSGGGGSTRKVNQDMLIIRHDYADKDHYFHFWPGGVKYLGSPSQAATLSGASGVVIAAANGDQFQEHIWNMGLAEFTADTVRALKDGGVPSFMLHAGWTRSSSSATPPDLTPLIARLDKLDVAVAAVPGAVIVEQKKPGN
jgi:hypothetical protein